MNEIQAALLAILPPSRKTTPSGWISFNSLCCHHRGESRDTRKRGGVLTDPKGGFIYHCFNCQFTCGWTFGYLLSENTKTLFRWSGLNDIDIGKLNLYALKVKEDHPIEKLDISFDLNERPLPEDCLPINTWISEGAQDPELMEVISYLIDERKVNWNWYKWHWSAANGYKDRVILPFYNNGKIVGYTGRKIKPGKPKYLTQSQPGYVFNLDAQVPERQYVIVTEGQFDAIAIDGVAIMHNEPNKTQCARINALGKTVIVVPDRDRPGAKMIQPALDNNWNVSIPPWDEDIKDVADAVKKYGRLYTLTTILHYQESNRIKIQLLKKKLEGMNE